MRNCSGLAPLQLGRHGVDVGEEGLDEPVQFLARRAEGEGPPLKEGNAQEFFELGYLAAYRRLLDAVGDIADRLGDATMTGHVVEQLKMVDIHGASNHAEDFFNVPMSSPDYKLPEGSGERGKFTFSVSWLNFIDSGVPQARICPDVNFVLTPNRWQKALETAASLTATFSLALLVALALAVPGCSPKRFAVNRLGNALAGSGSSFASDDDPDLVKAAAPFSLKLMEGMLEESPRHQKLLLATASGFTQFAYAFVEQDADRLEDKDLEGAEELKVEARRLYLRARNYGLRGLEVRHPGFGQRLRQDPRQAVLETKRKDVALLYWTAASWAAAVSLAKDNPNLIADLPLVEAMTDRALALDEGFGDGAIHSFLITYEMSRANGAGNPAVRARQHFERAVALTGGQQAGPFVAMAEAVSLQKQDLAEFKSLLNRALAVNPDGRPEWRLANLVMQRRAKWLLGRTDELFLTREPNERK